MFPDGVETITMTKEDYDRNVEQLLYDKINAELKIEKTIKYINKHCVNEKISKEVGYKCYTMADTNELENIIKILGGE